RPGGGGGRRAKGFQPGDEGRLPPAPPLGDARGAEPRRDQQDQAEPEDGGRAHSPTARPSGTSRGRTRRAPWKGRLEWVRNSPSPLSGGVSTNSYRVLSEKLSPSTPVTSEMQV